MERIWISGNERTLVAFKADSEAVVRMVLRLAVMWHRKNAEDWRNQRADCDGSYWEQRDEFFWCSCVDKDKYNGFWFCNRMVPDCSLKNEPVTSYDIACPVYYNCWKLADRFGLIIHSDYYKDALDKSVKFACEHDNRYGMYTDWRQQRMLANWWQAVLTWLENKDNVIN